RVYMANIAQAVNVLQAVLLTEGTKTVKTPTYHVFDLYKRHQDAELIYSHIENESAADSVPCLSQSASVGGDGRITVTISNCSLDKEFTVDIGAAFGSVKSAEGRILAAEVHAHNDFNNPENVVIKPLEVNCSNGGAELVLPACSAAEIVLSV
ncbi:MAG: alpha-L-arabinofuranosidase C-terminal domain-containing protein, partial [Oscillospiraceae bacterium]